MPMDPQPTITKALAKEPRYCIAGFLSPLASGQPGEPLRALAAGSSARSSFTLRAVVSPKFAICSWGSARLASSTEHARGGQKSLSQLKLLSRLRGPENCPTTASPQTAADLNRQWRRRASKCWLGLHQIYVQGTRGRQTVPTSSRPFSQHGAPSNYLVETETLCVENSAYRESSCRRHTTRKTVALLQTSSHPELACASRKIAIVTQVPSCNQTVVLLWQQQYLYL